MAAQPINWMSAINANRVNSVTPTGSGTWTPGKNGGPATFTETLNPTLTAANARANRTQLNATNASAGVLSNPTLNFNKIPKMTVNPGMTGQNAIMSRLAPQIERERAGLHTQLVNWGLQPGSEAYNEAMARQGEQENDLLSRAAIGGIGLDTEAHRQGVSDQQAAINTPLNALNTMAGRSEAPYAPGTGIAGSVQDTLAPLIAQNQQQTDQRNSSRQNTMDWLNLGVQGIRSVPAITDWASGIDWSNLFGGP